MDLKVILYPVLILAVMGAAFGILLSVASKVFAVHVDDKVIAIRSALPGANCGACGFPGCDGLAQAIADGRADISSCSIGGELVANKLAEILGKDSVEFEKQVATVLCQGDCNTAKNKYTYQGLEDCRLISDFQNGSKTCQYGCVGGGSCVGVCEYDAIHIVDSIAIVDKDKCVACMKCINICPKNIIKAVPYSAKTVVKCISQDLGKNVKLSCSKGCIGCKICEKNCPKEAIHVENNFAEIDYDKCINCGICVSKCPTSAIYCEYPEKVEKIKQRQKELAEKKKRERLEKVESQQ